NYRVGTARRPWLSQVVGFLGHASVRDAAVLGLDADRKLTVCAITVHAFDIGFNKLPGDLGILFNIVVPRGDTAEGIVKAVFREIDEVLAAFPLGVDRFPRWDDKSDTLADEERCEFFVTAGWNSFLVQAGNAFRGQ